MPNPGARDDRPRPVLLAVDGGASKTDVALVAPDGSVLGTARGAASNHQMVGLDGAMDNLAATVDEALAVAGLPRRSGVDAPGPVCPLGVYCLAGLDLPVDDERVGPAVRARGWTDRCDLYNDAFAVLRAGATGPFGVGVVCGTGLNCVGVGPGNHTVRFPSLGELSGDFTPGGAWLGVRGLGLALRAGDGRGEPTILSRLVPEHLGLDTPEAVLEAVYAGELPFARLVALARVVLEAAEIGDGPSGSAVDELVGEVVAMAVAALARLELLSEPAEVVAGGGIFENRRFSGLVLEGVRAVAPAAVLRPLAGSPPVLGAALLGLDALGAGPGAEARLRTALAGR